MKHVILLLTLIFLCKACTLPEPIVAIQTPEVQYIIDNKGDRYFITRHKFNSLDCKKIITIK